VEVDVTGRALTLTARLEAQAVGEVTYDAAQGAFFLRAPRRVTLSNVRAGVDGPAVPLPALVDELVRRLVPGLVDQVLEALPVYVLNESKPDEKRVRERLKTVRVRDGALVIELN